MTRKHDTAGMISTDDLDRLFQLARAHPPREEEWATMLRAAEPRARGRIPRWSWLTGVAAAVISGLVLLGWPKTPTASAFASIAKATAEAGVVKQIIQNGPIWEQHCELWAARGRFSGRVVNQGELIEYRDMRTSEMATYMRSRNAVIRSSYDPGDAERAYYGTQTVDDVVNWLESLGHDPAGWTRRTLERDGRSLVEYANGSIPQSYYCRFVADAATSRLVEIENSSGVTRFEYPDTEPRDVFDLGAPRDARVIDGRAPEPLLRLRDRVMAQAANGFGAYRAAVVQTGAPAVLHQVVTDGVRVRTHSYLLDNLSTADEVLLAAREFLSSPPRSRLMNRASVFDGEMNMQVDFDREGQPRLRFVRARALATYWANTLEGQAGIYACAFFSNWGDSQLDYFDSDPRGWVGFRKRGQANEVSRPYSWEKWYDPHHGYREAMSITTNYPTADWQLDQNWTGRYDPGRALITPPDSPAERSEMEVVQWAELRPGLWYPRLRTWRSLTQRNDGTWALREWPNCETCRAVTHVAIVAEPLDSVDPAEFAIPPAWLEIPISQ